MNWLNKSLVAGRKGENLIAWGLLLITVSRAQAQTPRSTTLLHRAESNLTRTIVHDIFSPPAASRIYLYANAAAYEAMAHGNEAFQSLHGQVAGFPFIGLIPKPGKINNELAAVYAFFQTGGKLIFSEHLLQDSAKVILSGFKETDSVVYENSINFGAAVSDSILAWAAKDNYLKTRAKRRYSYDKNPGKWIPTPPGYMDAVEPYWNLIRPVTLDSANQFQPMPPPAFSLDTASQFMKEVYEVYHETKELTDTNRLIANFWDCNPFYLNTKGHLNFATKKLSPGGHWISIAGQVTQAANLGWIPTLEAYLLTSVALFDGFISCWDEKYRSQLIRPETIINAQIDENWLPLLQTPPFPEYTSGHSVISTAAATVLTRVLGDGLSFDDHTEVEYGLPVRSFKSFRMAAEEAAISRLYGGIHFRSAIEQGQIQGARVGSHVLGRIRLRK